MGIFSNIESAEGGSAKTYIPSGYRGTVEIARCKLVASKKPGADAQYFVAETTYSTVDAGDVSVGAAGTIMFRVSPDPYSFGLADTRALIAAAAACPESDVDESTALAACGVDSDGNPIPGDGGTLLAGNVLRVEAIAQTAKGGNSYTKYTFAPV